MFGPCEGLGTRLRNIENSTVTPTANTNRVIIPNFTCQSTDQVKDLVKLIGNRTVEKAASNLKAYLPYGIAGIIYEKQTSTTCSLLILGEFGGFSGLITGNPIFVSPTGTLIQIGPSTEILQHIGMAISTTEIILNISPPIRRAG